MHLRCLVHASKEVEIPGRQGGPPKIVLQSIQSKDQEPRPTSTNIPPFFSLPEAQGSYTAKKGVARDDVTLVYLYVYIIFPNLCLLATIRNRGDLILELYCTTMLYISRTGYIQTMVRAEPAKPPSWCTE
jgi:hypothetical protein